METPIWSVACQRLKNALVIRWLLNVFTNEWVKMLLLVYCRDYVFCNWETFPQDTAPVLTPGPRTHLIKFIIQVYYITASCSPNICMWFEMYVGGVTETKVYSCTKLNSMVLKMIYYTTYKSTYSFTTLIRTYN